MPIQYTLAQEVVVEAVREFLESTGKMPVELHVSHSVWNALAADIRPGHSVGAVEHRADKIPSFAVVGIPIWIGGARTLTSQHVTAHAEKQHQR
jgi:hypothetical protein